MAKSYECFYSAGERVESMYGCLAPRDADRESVLDAILWEFEALQREDVPATHRMVLAAALEFIPVRSVVKSDWDELGDDCMWHTEASGKRVRDCWWLAPERLQAELDVMEKG